MILQVFYKILSQNCSFMSVSFYYTFRVLVYFQCTLMSFSFTWILTKSVMHIFNLRSLQRPFYKWKTQRKIGKHSFQN